MRRSLDLLYRVTTWLAATSMVALLAVLATQIVARLVGTIIVWSDDVAGFLLVATSFLAMAGTFRSGVHVRVALLVSRAGSRIRRLLEVWCLVLCAALSAYMAYASIDQMLDSIRYDERTGSIVPFQIWIPQAVMSFGIVVFCIANIDALVEVLRGRRPIYATGDAEGAYASADQQQPPAERDRYAAAE